MMTIDVVVCELGLVFFGTALYFLLERYFSKPHGYWAVAIIGLAMALYSAVPHYYPKSLYLLGKSFYIFPLLGGCGLLGYDIYLRRSASRGSEIPVLSLRFYPNRVSLDRSRGTLSDELQRHGETFWVAWQTGAFTSYIEPVLRRKIHRMILGNPNAPTEVLEAWARAAHVGNGEAIRSKLLETTRLAVEVGTPVKYINEQSTSLVIANPNNTIRSGWIRVEYILPFLHPTSRPSFVLLESDFPDAYNSLVRAYDEIWASATEPSH